MPPGYDYSPSQRCILHRRHEDRSAALAYPEDAIIYEVHVRDFLSSIPNQGMANKGRYLAFTEPGTTGPAGVATEVDHLKESDITHVQIQPVQTFASADELDPKQYNWGDHPCKFPMSQGSYATTPHGTARITECKQMIQSLHLKRGSG